MSSGCGDVLSLADLQTAKKHQIFEAEVITGKSGGVAGGADIDYATNAVTGQTQKTLPAVLRDAGFTFADFDFSTGGTLSDADRISLVLWPESSGGDGNYYQWLGVLPKTIPAMSSPGSSGGIGPAAWKVVVGVGFLLTANAFSEIADAGLQSLALSHLGLSEISGLSNITSASGVSAQRLSSGYNFIGLSTSENVINSNVDAIKDPETGLFWVYEGVISSPVSVPSGTVPPAQPLARYTSTNWRCVGLLNGYKETNAKNYGAKCDGVTDDYYSYQLALYHTKSRVTHVGDARIATSTLIKPVGVSIVGASGYVGAQLGINIPATTFTFDGPFGKDTYAIDNGESAGTEDSGRVQYVYLRAVNDSKDNLSAVKLTKAGQLMDCGILNFWNGVKYDGGSAYVQIHRNNINSCNCCIDAAGSESHITNNHGYNDSLRTSAQFRPAILIRSAGNIVTENKFFGDGANTPKGVEIWGPGNVVANNVFDAFTDIGVLITCNDASVLPDNNLISGNQITGIGDSSDVANTFRAGVVVSNSGAGAGTITGTVITGNSMYNRRTDRQMQYGVVINAVSGSLPDSRTIYNTLITGNTFGFGITGRKVIALGANHSGSRSNNNSGVITEAIGSGAYANGAVIPHGMSRPPEFIEFTLIDSGSPVAISFSAVTDTTFTIIIRDSSGGISGTRAVSWKASRLTP
nr:MAG TPA: tailspike protein [Caudoviricetes sp.]